MDVSEAQDKVCFSCNSLNSHDAKFCVHCGARFDVAEEKRTEETVTCLFCAKDAVGHKAAKSIKVQCKHCGMYIPEPEAIRSQERWYCSAEHRDADQRGVSGDRQ